MSDNSHWIEAATKNHGALHRHLGIPIGQKIGSKRITAAEKSSNPTVEKEARLAKTLIGMHKK